MSTTAEATTYYERVKEYAASLGIKELMGRETVTYYPANKRRDSEGRFIFPMTVQIPHDTKIIHPKTGKMFHLVYVESERPITKGGETRTEEVRPQIFLEGGALTLGAKDNRLYLHMELLDYNGSNPIRDDSVEIKFYREDKAKTARDKVNEGELLEDAIRLARTMPLEEAKEYARRLKMYDPGAPGSVTVEEIRANLMYKAKEDPGKFIRESKNAKGLAKLRVAEAKAYKIITQDEFNWKFTDGDEVIASVDQDASDPLEAFVNWLLKDPKDGKKALRTIENKLKKEE